MKIYKGILTGAVLSLILSACSTSTTPAKITSYNPKAAKINRELAVKYYQNNDIKTAQQKINLAMKQNPKSPLIMDTAAYVYSRAGNQKAAKKYFEQAIDLAPTKGRYHNNYGAYLCKKGHVRFGVDQLLMAGMDESYAHRDAAYENAGLCAQQGKHWEMAADYYMQALKINPKRPNALLELGQISYDRHLYKKAQAFLKRYNKVAKPTAESLWLGVQVAQKMKDPAVAAKNAAALKQQFPKAQETRLLVSRQQHDSNSKKVAKT